MTEQSDRLLRSGGSEVPMEYRVVCADGAASVTFSSYTAAYDLRSYRDGDSGKAVIHGECGPHRVESRQITYGPWS